MLRERLRPFHRWRAVLGAVALFAGPMLQAQGADSVAHRGSHAMSWGRETFILSEVLEYGPALADRPVDFDLVGWTGGAVHRVWAKAEGSVATRGRAQHGSYQLLYGKLISPWWDMQLGVRVDQNSASSSSATRAGALVGLQGLAPGWFEVEPSLFVTTDGNVSLDVTASYDLFLTQRIVLQPRVESSAALGDDDEFGIGRGLSKTSFGLRTRIELQREFAPYVGVVWDRSYGQTRRLARASGAASGESRFVAGLRLWR